MGATVIAIDGTAASGKGTLGRRLAEDLGFVYLDTGKLYRYVAWMVLQQGGNPADEADVVSVAERIKDGFDPAMLQNDDLKRDEVGSAASQVATYQGVRTALLDYQRSFASGSLGDIAGAILDGRDIGTIVCPDADIKLFVSADIEVRAKRRFKELHSMGIPVTYDTVLADMQERDMRDSGRDTAPMKPASDAIMLDTSDMPIEEVYKNARDHIKAKLGI